MAKPTKWTPERIAELKPVALNMNINELSEYLHLSKAGAKSLCSKYGVKYKKLAHGRPRKSINVKMPTVKQPAFIEKHVSIKDSIEALKVEVKKEIYLSADESIELAKELTKNDILTRAWL